MDSRNLEAYIDKPTRRQRWPAPGLIFECENTPGADHLPETWALPEEESSSHHSTDIVSGAKLPQRLTRSQPYVKTG
jgi:hypothetical protein